MAGNVNNVSSSIYCKACGAANPTLASRCYACQQPLVQAMAGSGARTNPLTGLLLPDVILYQRYRILEVLSEGNVSTVYKAEDMQLGNRQLALKEIGKNNQKTREALEAIEESKREMLSLAALVHPNLPRIYDYFVENHRWYFVMDLLEGETLAAYLGNAPYRSLPAEEVIDIGMQLSTVLDYLHIRQSPLGFKDLTLDTLWRTLDGKLYILDTGTVPPAVVTPESQSISNLGSILRQLQTGKLPTSARPARRRIALPHRLHRRPRPPKHSQAAPLDALIRKMVHRNVTERPANMGVVRQELQHLANQQMLSTSRKRRIFLRRTFSVLGGLTGLAGLAATSSWLTDQVEFQIQRQIPHPAYSPKMGGTIHTYDAGNNVLSVAWSPNGARIAVGIWSPPPGLVQTCDADTGRHVIYYTAPGLQNRVETVIWLPDGTEIAAGGDDGMVWIWNAQNGDLLTTYGGHTNWVIGLACSPDGRYIASASYDKTVQVWEVATGRTVVTYRGHSDSVTSVVWSPDGQHIVSGSYDNTVQVWEAASGRTVCTYLGHTNHVYTVAWSPDGQYIASGGADKTVRVWAAAGFTNAGQQLTGSLITYNGHSTAVQTVVWSPDSRKVASAGDTVQLWYALTGDHIFTYTAHAGQIVGLAWSPNGRYIASGGMDHTVQIWNATDQGNGR
jgi:WD40 repeat protein